MKKYFLISILLVCGLLGAEPSKTDLFKRSTGVYISNISGFGWYYRQQVIPDYHLKATGIIYYYEFNFGDNSQEPERKFNYNLGLELQKDFIKTSAYRFYGLLGAYYDYDKWEKKNTLPQQRP